MATTPKILIVGPDPKLPQEFNGAVAGIRNLNVITHTVADYRQGVEAARSRRPDLILVEMGKNLRVLTNFTEEVAAAVPETLVAAVFAPEVFGHEVSESAIIIEAIRAGVKDFLRRPLSSLDLEQLLDRLVRRATAQQAKLGSITAFISNKGGVGKSTLSVNVACGLAQRFPEQVLLVDASLQMGVCASMLDLHPATSITDAVRERNRLDEALLRQLAVPHASGLHLLAAPADAVEAAEVDDESMARILTLARRAYAHVIVDTFPVFDRIVMAVLDLSDQFFVIVESLVPAVLGAAKLVQLLNNLGYHADRRHLVINRHLNDVGHLKPADIEQRLGAKVDFVVPYEKKILVATNLGQPYILGPRPWFSGCRKVLDQLVEVVARQTHVPGEARPRTGEITARDGTGEVTERKENPHG